MLGRAFIVFTAVATAIGGTFALRAQDLGDAEQPLPCASAAATMRVPAGFRVTLFAGEPDVRQPIGFCLDDRARLWVAEAYNYPVKSNDSGDRIVIFEDSDGDGRHDKRTVFYDQLNYVTGVEFGFGGAWVMSPPNLYFIPDADGDDVPDGEPEIVLDGFGTHANAHNLANGLAWGPDGWLYGTHGRTNWSMIGTPGTPQEERVQFDGGVYRYHPIRKVWESYADGTTNPWGIDWNDYGHAFICNCVNPHLFQVIQGAHYEPWRGRKSSQYAYQRIDTIADHLHFVGIADPRTGLGSEAEDSAGGGHAHCGTLIYLADDFPARYRNQLLTNNIHGRRINNDLLRREGSGYVASHGDDFARSNDPWFMGVTLAQGPAGEVYVSDWSDTGECHSTRNTRRQTGRLFRIQYGNQSRPDVDIAALSSDGLVDLQLNRNDWYVRHARRVLQERAAAGNDLKSAMDNLQAIVRVHSDTTRRLRALWTLHVCQAVNENQLRDLLSDEDEHLRSWAVTLLCEYPDRAHRCAERLVALARTEDSPLVRLSLASALQRLEPSDRWPLGEALAAHGEDAADANLPLMIWYGVEPLIEDDLKRFANLAAVAALPRVRINAARRIASAPSASQGIDQLVQTLSDGKLSEAQQADLLAGMLTGLEGRRQFPMPAAWPAAFLRLKASTNPAIAAPLIQLALRFGDPKAIETLQKNALDGSLAQTDRRRALAALVDRRLPDLDTRLLTLLDDPALRGEALAHLASYSHPRTATEILERFGTLTTDEKPIALQTLASRVEWGRLLLAAIERGDVKASDVDAFTARQLHALNDPKLSSQLDSLWGNLRPTTKELTNQIRKAKQWLTPTVLQEADFTNGKALFTKHCANCHRLFGEGGKIGPDLSGAQRTNLDYMLENIIAPSMTVSKDYQMQVIVTADGRVITGLIESDEEAVLTILTATERISLPKSEIESRAESPTSMMPTGLLEPLSDREIRDLMGYLQRR